MPDRNEAPESEPPKGRFPKVSREPLISSNQAAAMLKVHPRTVRRLVRCGKIAAVQVGKLWRFKSSTLEAWIDKSA